LRLFQRKTICKPISHSIPAESNLTTPSPVVLHRSRHRDLRWKWNSWARQTGDKPGEKKMTPFSGSLFIFWGCSRGFFTKGIPPHFCVCCFVQLKVLKTDGENVAKNKQLE